MVFIIHDLWSVHEKPPKSAPFIAILKCLILCLEIDSTQTIAVPYTFLVTWLLGYGTYTLLLLQESPTNEKTSWDNAFKKYKIKCFSHVLFLKKNIYSIFKIYLIP